MIKTPDLEAKP